jgi:hypothetical protein
MAEPLGRWIVVIKIAVDAAGEADARPVVHRVLDAMGVTVPGNLPFVRFDDGTWVTELQLDKPAYQQAEQDNALNVLSSLKVNLGPVTWRGGTDTPSDPDSAGAAQLEWPPGFWTVAGQKQMLIDRSVRAMLLQVRRDRTMKPS